MSEHSRRSIRTPVIPEDLRNPGESFLRQELEQNRKSERWLVAKALIAVGLVVVLIVIREVVFL